MNKTMVFCRFPVNIIHWVTTWCAAGTACGCCQFTAKGTRCAWAEKAAVAKDSFFRLESNKVFCRYSEISWISQFRMEGLLWQYRSKRKRLRTWGAVQQWSRWVCGWTMMNLSFEMGLSTSRTYTHKFPQIHSDIIILLRELQFRSHISLPGWSAKSGGCNQKVQVQSRAGDPTRAWGASEGEAALGRRISGRSLMGDIITSGFNMVILGGETIINSPVDLLFGTLFGQSQFFEEQYRYHQLVRDFECVVFNRFISGKWTEWENDPLPPIFSGVDITYQSFECFHSHIETVS